MIKAIIYCEFDAKAGPKIVYQDPEDYMPKEIFDANHCYIITKPQLKDKIITKVVDDIKIIGRPIYIEDTKYDRNAFICNICFVCDQSTETDSVEIVVKKLSEYLKVLEKEEEALSNVEKKKKLLIWIQSIRSQLNTFKTCSLTIGDGKMIHLKIENYTPNQAELKIKDHDVPVIVPLSMKFDIPQWDITMQQILPYIDGFNHVRKISLLADVDVTFVKACVETLLYKGLIKIVSIIQYSNCYMCLPNVHKIMTDSYFQMQCQKYVSTNENFLPNIKDILQIYSSMTHSTSISNLCQQYSPRLLKINERKLVLFGLVHEIIRQIQKYPISTLTNTNDGEESELKSCTIENYSSGARQRIGKILFDGTHSYDEICCQYNLSQAELDDICDELEDTIVLHA